MIFTKAVTYEDIKKQLDKDSDIITIIGCETCVRVAGSGGQKRMKELAVALRKEGFTVKDGYMVPSCCTPKIYFAKLKEDVNTVISLACNAGTSNLSRTYEGYKVIAATQDVGLMITDTEKNIIKVTVPYEKFNDEKGREFVTLTGHRNDTDSSLPIMEVQK